jgi:type VI secretion system protein ImpG
MDPRLLEHYLAESGYITASMGEFGEAHPKMAARLGISANEIADPFVKRLLQTFAFVSARGTMRLEEEFPEFIVNLLDAAYPNFTTPTPSITMARAYPGSNDRGIVLPRGTLFTSHVIDEEQTACEFTSTQDVVLYPLEITQARLTGVPADITSLYRYLNGEPKVHGALRLTLRTLDGAPISSLNCLDRLPIYLPGDDVAASHLFELLHSAALSLVIGTPGDFATGTLHGVTREPIVHEGLESEHSLLSGSRRRLHGHSLVQEYFIAPWRFWFFTLNGLRQAFSAIESSEVEIVVLLGRSAGRLADAVTAADFALFCTPLVNAFHRTTEALPIDPGKPGNVLTPVPERPRDYQIHSVSAIRAQNAQESRSVVFQSWHDAMHDDGKRGPGYFALRRARNLTAMNERTYGIRRDFIETRTSLAFVDESGMPTSQNFQSVVLDAVLTNRELPCLIERNGRDDLSVERSLSATRIGLIRTPTMPLPPLAHGRRAWELYGQLHLGYPTFDTDIDDPAKESERGEGVRRRLRMYLHGEAGSLRGHVEAIVGASSKPVTCRLPDDFGQPFGRGIECTLTVDESRLEGVSPYTLGLVLERYFSRYVSAHSVTTTILDSVQRGRIAQWKARQGSRGVA